ncbi:porin [Coraliomargarita sp. SDUM461004]|uniref:Porin n=1 Tax=Thalassobacterium sedimentorum TaxID=3041258 RepID=A0ABU1AL41_9BACT|nr:porin [Coraliomargarita sp. SDUM461004]MDQ8194303.1 porin [Coraliomargarita sp. SDUM461004]
MKLNKLTQYFVLSAALVSAPSLAATNDALLDKLVEKGILTQGEAIEIASEIEQESQGISFSAKGKETLKLRFNGRMQFQYDHLAGELNGESTESTNHFYFRRVFLGVKASLANGVYAETVLDFAGDEQPEIAFDKVAFGYKFDDAFDAQLGFQKVPFGFEETSSSSSLQTIERSAANRFFADDIDFSSRHAGIHAQGDLGAGFSYALALVNGAQGEGSKLLGSAEGSNDLAAFGRIQWAGIAWMFGVDAGSQSNNSVVGEDVVAYTAYANYKYEGINLLGEFFSANMGDEEDVTGYALRASYKFNKFEPVIRYSYIETDSFDIDTDELIRRAPTDTDNLSLTGASGIGKEMHSFYLGANYYYSPAVTFMAGYEVADVETDADDEADVDGFRARVQVLW